jgi:UDP-glucose 4-epimerase
MPQTIIVTGGAGFVGSHLCEALAKAGHYVISLDNYFTGSRDNHVAGVEYREGHTKDITRHIPENPDIIYHLGEYSRVAQSLEEPELVWNQNIAGTLGVLEFWRAKKNKLIYAGSSTKGVGPRTDGTLGRDLAPYTWAKAAMSDLVNDYGKWYSLPYAITYFYNVYGPRERAIGGYGTVIETFRQQFLKGQPLTVRSPGTQRRLFTHVADTVAGLLLVGEKGMGDGYGISSADDYSLLEVAELFGDQVEMLPATPTTRENAVADADKTKALGWTQTKTLKGYIAEAKRLKD